MALRPPLRTADCKNYVKPAADLMEFRRPERLHQPFFRIRRKNAVFLCFRRKQSRNRIRPADIHSDIVYIIVGRKEIPCSLPRENHRVRIPHGKREFRRYRRDFSAHAAGLAWLKRTDILLVPDYSFLIRGAVRINHPRRNGRKLLRALNGKLLRIFCPYAEQRNPAGTDFPAQAVRNFKSYGARFINRGIIAPRNLPLFRKINKIRSAP